MHVAISHWSAGGSGTTDTSKQVGVFQYCGKPSGAALKDFMLKYPYTDSPEPERDVTRPMIGPDRIAIVSGYFNPIHIGHLQLIKAARELAPHLVVIVNNDRQQLLKKGRILMDRGRPAADRGRAALRGRGVRRRRRRPDGGRVAAPDPRRLPAAELLFCNGGDRSPSGDPAPEAELADEIGLQMVYGVGGADKADSSTRINEELSRADTPAEHTF